MMVPRAGGALSEARCGWQAGRPPTGAGRPAPGPAEPRGRRGGSRRGEALLADDILVGVIVEVRPHPSHGAVAGVELVIDIVHASDVPPGPVAAEPLDLVGHHFAGLDGLVDGGVKPRAPATVLGRRLGDLGAGSLGRQVLAGRRSAGFRRKNLAKNSGDKFRRRKMVKSASIDRRALAALTLPRRASASLEWRPSSQRAPWPP